MHRLFVALRPPPPMRRLLIDAMGGVPGARWQDEEQLHLTLRFIGEVDRPQADDIAAALGSVTRPQPTIALSGWGTFDHKGRVHSLWVGVSADAGLSGLRDRVNRALATVGIAPEGRAFKPHFTIARFSRGAGPIEPVAARLASIHSEPVTLDAFLLYESHLGHDGASYEAVARYPLS